MKSPLWKRFEVDVTTLYYIFINVILRSIETRVRRMLDMCRTLMKGRWKYLVCFKGFVNGDNLKGNICVHAL